MSTNRGCMSYYRYEHRDPYNPKYYTAITCSVMGPSIERPYVSVLISFANATGKVTLRCRNIVEAQNIITLPLEAVQRLQESVSKGNIKADELERTYKLMFELRKLPTGETEKAILNIEQFLKENQTRGE
jgi:hypothetical protein